MTSLTYDHLVIALGKGAIEVGQGHEGPERLPAILFGRNGAGTVGVETEGDRTMLPGECIAAITFENPESLDVVAEKLAELRARIWPDAQQPVVSAWQPIATAPQNGRTLLLGRFNELGNWRTMRGQWFSTEAIAQDWEDPDDAEEGWYETAVEPDAPNCWSIAPTHWMPLPTAPTAGVQP